MKAILLAVALCFAVPVWADSVTQLSGKIHDPGEVITYSFAVQMFIGPTFIADVLNGQVVLRDGAIGCHPCTTSYVNDVFEFLPGESVILAEFGFHHTFDLIGTANGVTLVDPPGPSAAVSEPGLIALVFVGSFMLKARRAPRANRRVQLS